MQILVYDCDPLKPDLSEIARVTDYVVAYSCKGNASIKEEREQLKNLVLRYVREALLRHDGNHSAKLLLM